jgi:HlyD family type I secretion membrane fusion protein
LNAHPPIVLGLAVIVLALGGFGTWAAVAPIASAVIAAGFVTVDTSRKEVQHLEGGTVKELLVRDGDAVKAGDVLIRLDETRAKASLGILQARYDAARALRSRLLAERDEAEVIGFPEDLVAVENDDPKVRELLVGQQNLFEARRRSLEGEVEILESQVTQLHDDITGIEAQQVAKERQIVLIHEEAGSLKDLLDKGYADRPRFLALQREIARLEGERGEHVSEIARAKTRIGETRLQVIQLHSDFREQVVTELRSLQTELADLEERLSAAKHTLAHIEIRAPTDGIVVGLGVHTIGAVIQGGETLMEIVPADDKLLIEAKVKPEDIDNVVVGQDAEVRFTAFKQRTTPTVQGEIIYVSADRVVDERLGQAYYIARAAVADEQVARLGERKLQPGMPAEVMIKTGDTTALHYLAQPLLDGMNRAWREE